MSDYLKFIVPVTSLIPRGYRFQKLYAHNYKTYRKDFKGGYKIWLWVKERRLEINDWFDTTGKVISFVKDNSHLAETSKMFPECVWLKFKINRDLREVLPMDFDNYLRDIQKWYKDNEGWDMVTLEMNSFNAVLGEVDWLTK